MSNAPVAVQWKGVTVYRPPHQLGSCDSTVPKYNYVSAEAGGSANAFKVSGANIKFKLSKEIGTVYNTALRFLINNEGTTAVAAPPTPHWVKYIQVQIGNEILETLYPQDIYNETLGFLNLDELEASRETINASAADYRAGANLPVGESFRYMPFNNCISTARIYNAGLTDDVVFWIYFADSLFGTNANIKLSDCLLIVEEDTHVQGDDKTKWESASKGTLVYNTVVRQRQTETVDRTSSNKNTIKLNSLSGNSAGIVVYSNSGASPSATNAADLTTRNLIATLEVQNQMGNKITEELRGEWLQSYSWTDNVRTAFAAKVPTYLIPFSANFRRALEDGTNCGSKYFNSKDKLVIGPASANRTETFTVTNYVYTQVIISDGKYQVAK